MYIFINVFLVFHFFLHINYTKLHTRDEMCLENVIKLAFIFNESSCKIRYVMCINRELTELEKKVPTLEATMERSQHDLNETSKREASLIGEVR